MGQLSALPPPGRALFLPARSASISQRAKAFQSTRSLGANAQTFPHALKTRRGQGRGRGSWARARAEVQDKHPDARSWLSACPRAPDVSPCQNPHTREIRLCSHRGSTEEVQPQLRSGPDNPHSCFPRICPLDRLPLGAPLAVLHALRPSTDHNTAEVSTRPPDFAILRF